MTTHFVMMADSLVGRVFILITGVSKGNKEEPVIFPSGELIVEIPPKQQVALQEGVPPHNYCLLRDGDVTLYSDDTGVAPLVGTEADYLEGIQDPASRIANFRMKQRLQWIMGLSVGSIVYFKLRGNKSGRAPLQAEGVIRYYGAVEGERGVMFGIEIMDPEHRGKGNTDGSPHFRCNQNDGMFVSMDKIIQRVEEVLVTEKECLVNTMPPLQQGPVQDGGNDQAANDDNLARKTRTLTHGWFSKAVSFISRGEEDQYYDSAAPAAVESRFTVGDSVVVQNIKEQPIAGVVRWVGHMISSGKVIVPIAIGIETVCPVEPRKDFPDTHLKVTGSYGQQLFKIDTSKNHGRLFLPEVLVLHAKEYAIQKKEETSFDAREAKKRGLPVDEYKEQTTENESVEEEGDDTDVRRGSNLPDYCDHSDSTSSVSEGVSVQEEEEWRQLSCEDPLAEGSDEFLDHLSAMSQKLSVLYREKVSLLQEENRKNAQLMERHIAEQQDEIKRLRNEAISAKQEYDMELERVTTDKNELEKLVKQFQRSWRISHEDISMTKEKLGEGGWGGVSVGVFREQRVAVKQLHKLIVSKENLALMNREISTMSRLRHPNLLLFIGAALDHPSGNPLLVVEIMDISLRKAYETGQLTGDGAKLSVLRDTAAGLNYLHCHPDEIIHRDVSSANVLLESRGPNKWRAKLSDFGSANIASDAFTLGPGALVYSAPEILQNVRNKKKVQQTCKADVFSFGVLMCEVIACKFPDDFDDMVKGLSADSLVTHLILECTKDDPASRPAMRNVLRQMRCS